MPPRSNPADLGPGVTPREAALDPIYRFVQAMDFSDEAMVRTAFVDDAVFSVSGMTDVISRERSELRGIEAISKRAIGGVGQLATEHHVSNPRVRMSADGREAFVTAYAFAQHFPKGQGSGGSGPDRRRFTQGNYYAVEVVREEGEAEIWKIRQFELSNLWSEGDPSVLEGV